MFCVCCVDAVELWWSGSRLWWVTTCCAGLVWGFVSVHLWLLLSRFSFMSPRGWGCLENVIRFICVASVVAFTVVLSYEQLWPLELCWRGISAFPWQSRSKLKGVDVCCLTLNTVHSVCCLAAHILFCSSLTCCQLIWSLNSRMERDDWALFTKQFFLKPTYAVLMKSLTFTNVFLSGIWSRTEYTHTREHSYQLCFLLLLYSKLQQYFIIFILKTDKQVCVHIILCIEEGKTQNNWYILQNITPFKHMNRLKRRIINHRNIHTSLGFTDCCSHIKCVTCSIVLLPQLLVQMFYLNVAW